MTKPIKASDRGLEPHYKVRVVVGSSLIHLASRTQPRIMRDRTSCIVSAEWIDDPEYGDTLGFVDWNAMTAITWRYSA